MWICFWYLAAIDNLSTDQDRDRDGQRDTYGCERSCAEQQRRSCVCLHVRRAPNAQDAPDPLAPPPVSRVHLSGNHEHIQSKNRPRQNKERGRDCKQDLWQTGCAERQLHSRARRRPNATAVRPAAAQHRTRPAPCIPPL
jgi:hypothetical protein